MRNISSDRDLPLCKCFSYNILSTHINQVYGEGCYGVVASVNTMVASSLVSRVTRIRGLPDFLKMCPYLNVFTMFVESEDYQMNVNMNIDWQWPKITKLKKCLFGGLGSH